MLGKTLIDRLMDDLARDGARPSRRRLAAYIRAGAARADGRVLTDPGAEVEPGAALAFDPDDADPTRLASARAARAGRSALPPGVLHADRQLVVVLREAFVPASGEPEGAEDGGRLAAAVLGRLPGAARALSAVLDPSAPGSGPVLLATGPAVARRLLADVRAGRVRESSFSLRAPALTGPDESIEQGGVHAALVRREDAPLGPPPPGCRELVPPARVLLVLKHPRTNRRLAFAAEPSAAFGAAAAAACEA